MSEYLISNAPKKYKKSDDTIQWLRIISTTIIVFNSAPKFQRKFWRGYFKR